MSTSLEAVREQARAAMSQGNSALAARVLIGALQTFPDNAPLWNSAGSASLHLGNNSLAAEQFARAHALAPTNLEYATNLAIALGKLARARDGLDVLAETELERAGRRDARYWSVRAGLARDLGLLAEAAQWYDTALAIDPRRAIALHGRARIALERSEPDAVAAFDAALAATPSDPHLWLGKAQALDAAGRFDEARALAGSIAEQAPQWIDALRFDAQLRHAAGERDIDAAFAEAARRFPGEPQIAISHCELLSSMDAFEEATDVAASARLRFPGDARFAMLEAVHAGEAGQNDRAETIWTELATSGPERDLHEARHRLRCGQPDTAATLLQRVVDAQHANVAAWALLGVAWRVLGDERAEWLHQQPGLVGLVPLVAAEGLLGELTDALHAIHDGSAPPLGQSLRGGSQTRGGLFDRHEPIFARLRDAVIATLADYRAELPADDPDHPLLRHRNDAWQLAGSWSVRLDGGGDFHTSHIHPQGTISSALYLELPSDVSGPDQQGWLEIGRPPADLRLDLPPLHVIRPREGCLALFPSTLYHGTRPFTGSQRLTVAFDVHSSGGA